MNTSKQCLYLTPEDKDTTIHFMKKNIKSKEEELIRKQEELENTPNRYIVRETIEKEVNSLATEIESMKNLTKRLEQI